MTCTCTGCGLQLGSLTCLMGKFKLLAVLPVDLSKSAPFLGDFCLTQPTDTVCKICTAAVHPAAKLSNDLCSSVRCTACELTTNDMSCCHSAGDGAAADGAGCSHVHPFCSNSDRPSDARGPRSHLQLPAKILPRILPLAIHHPPPGAHDKV